MIFHPMSLHCKLFPVLYRVYHVDMTHATPADLNKIPKESKILSKNSFKKQIKTSLFQILNNEDSYLDVENMHKFNFKGPGNEVDPQQQLVYLDKRRAVHLIIWNCPFSNREGLGTSL